MADNVLGADAQVRVTIAANGDQAGYVVDALSPPDQSEAYDALTSEEGLFPMEMAEEEREDIEVRRILGVPIDTVLRSLRGNILFISISLVAYFGLSLAYMDLEGWSWGDCLYFSVVVVTTVGYGDFLPSSDSSKLITVLFIHFALLIVVVALSNIQSAVVDHTVNSAVKRMKLEQFRMGLFDAKSVQKRRVYRVIAFVSIYAAFLCMSTIIYASTGDFDAADVGGNKWVNGLYMTVVTMSTVGFGDISPYHDSTKAFTCFVMLIGIPIFGAALSTLNSALFGRSQSTRRLRVIQNNLSEDKFNCMAEFVEKMRELGIGNYLNQGDGRISRFEYACFILMKNGVINMNNIQRMMHNFDKLDRSGTGFIEAVDVDAEGSVRALDQPSDQHYVVRV